MPNGPSDLSALAALSTPDEHSAAGAVEVALLEQERFADPQSRTPQQHNKRSESMTVGAVTDRAHYSDDLFDRRRIGRVLLALFRGGRPRWYPGMVAGERRWPATSSSTDSMNPPLVGQVDDALLFESSRRHRREGLPTTRQALSVSARSGTGARAGQMRGGDNSDVTVLRGCYGLRATPGWWLEP